MPSSSAASGQRIMCVWQAVSVLDPGHSATKGTARMLSVQDVTATLSRLCPSVHYTSKVFRDNFPDAVVNFDDYVNYVKVCLRDHSIPMRQLEEEFEAHCWEICRDSFSLHHCSMNEGDIFKVWQVFNRLCLPGTMPPVMDYDDVQWLGERLARASRQRWSPPHDGQLTFMEMLLDLDAVCFKSLSHSEVARVLDSVCSWLVREIILTGWMHKRTRKQANWTPWQRRWFVLGAGLLSYYTTPALTEKKNDVVLTDRSRVDDLDDLKMLIRSYPNRFRITNAPFLELELSADDVARKNEWMRAVHLVTRATRYGVSPADLLLADIRKQQRGERLSTDDLAHGLRIGAPLKKRRGRSDGEDDEDDEYEDDVDGSTTRNSGASSSVGEVDDYDTDEDGRGRRSSEENDSWVISYVLSCISKAVQEISESDGDVEEKGALDESEFVVFLHKLGICLSVKEASALHQNLGKNGDDDEDVKVDADTFIAYLLRAAMFEEQPEEGLQHSFLRACVHSHWKSQSPLKYRDLAEAIWRRQRLHYVKLMMEAFQRVGSGMEDEENAPGGESTMERIQGAFSREQSVLGTVLEGQDTVHVRHESLLAGAMRIDVDALAQYFYQKWREYPYKTPPSETRPEKIAGDKMLIDVIFHVTQPPDSPIPPRKVVDNFTWKRASKPGKSGAAIFPAAFDGIIPLVQTTSETLGYYGASMADADQLQATLVYNHCIHSFAGCARSLQEACQEEAQAECSSGTTAKRVSSEGPDRPSCLRVQEDPGIFCPLEEPSGYLVLGRVSGQTLELTGFEVPAFCSVYLPAGVVFCTDHLCGLWRRLFTGRATSIAAQMVQSTVDPEEEQEQEEQEWGQQDSIDGDSIRQRLNLSRKNCYFQFSRHGT